MTPCLTSERLFLRPYMDSDLKGSVVLFTDPEVMRYLSDGVMSWPATTGLFQKVFSIADHQDHVVWAVCTREDGKYIGSAELKPGRRPKELEIVYALGRPHWGKGYATELTELLVEHAFGELDADSVTATVDGDNTPAIHIIEKLGFHLVDTDMLNDRTTLLYAIDGARRADVAAAPSPA